MEQKRNCTIDFLRLLMALLIVALHCNPFAEYNALISYFPSQVLSRIGVPFFAAVAGYYFFQKEGVGKYFSTLCKYFEKYTIWSVIFLGYGFIANKNLRGGVILEFAEMYLFTGYYHLWYMLAIIYTIILLWILNKIPNAIKYFYKVSFFLLIIGILMFGYGKLFFGLAAVQRTFGLIDQNVNMQSQWLFSVVPFFMMGYGLQHYNNRFSKLYEKCEVLLPIISVTYIVEIMLLKLLNVMSSTTLCLTTYPVVLLLMLFAKKHPFIINQKVAKYCAGMASFIYFSHILFVLILQNLGYAETPTYLVTVILSGMLGIIIEKADNSVLKKLI